MRISVTNIDGLAYCLDADMHVDDILRRLRHDEPPTEQMLAGRVFHDILENPPSDRLDIVERDGHRFEFAFDGELALPEIRELKAEVPVRVNGTDIMLVGKVDCLHGKRVDDHKMTGQFAAERYTDAFQWRAYLWMFGCTQFRYNVFPAGRLQDGTWRIRGCEPLDFYSYHGLERDVMQRLGDYVDFCNQFMTKEPA